MDIKDIKTPLLKNHIINVLKENKNIKKEDLNKSLSRKEGSFYHQLTKEILKNEYSHSVGMALHRKIKNKPDLIEEIMNLNLNDHIEDSSSSFLHVEMLQAKHLLEEKVHLMMFKVNCEDFNILYDSRKIYAEKIKLDNTSSKFFNDCIVSLGEKCFLKHQSNAFRIGNRKNTCFWRGVYNCSNRDCLKFIFEIEEWNNLEKNDPIFSCRIEGERNHEMQLKPPAESFYGLQRTQKALEIMAEGSLNTYYSDTLSQNNTEVSLSSKTKRLNVFYKIKNEFDNRNQIDSNVFQDAFLSKRIFDIFDKTSKHLKGYVQFYSIDPFIMILMCEVQKNILPDGVVTDFSFSLINSIQQVFNQFTIEQYLEACFDYLVNKKELSNRIYVKSFLCAAHMIKLISTKAKKLTIDKEISETFTFFFSVLLNSTDLMEFEKNLLLVTQILSSRKHNKLVDQAIEYFDTLNSKNETKKEMKKEEVEEDVNHDDKNDESVEDKTNGDSEKVLSSIRSKSPFTSYFENIKKSALNTLNEMDTNEEDNIYFCPQFLKIIFDYMFIMPLWSGVLLNVDNDENAKITRITNNYVENNFKIVKHSILNEKLNLCSPHEICAKFLLKIKAEMLHYNIDTNFVKDDLPICFLKDIWVDKKKKRRRSNKSYFDSFEMKKTKKIPEKKKSNKIHLSSSEHSLHEEKEKSDYKVQNLRSVQFHLPSNSTIFKESRGKRNIQIYNCCTINYFLYSIWLSVDQNLSFLTELTQLASSNRHYELIKSIFERIDANDWGRAKYMWLTDCLQMEKNQIEYNCEGSLFDFFVKFMQQLQIHSLKKECTNCGLIGFNDSNKEFLLTSDGKFYLNEKCKECDQELMLEIRFIGAQKPLWIVFESCNSEIEISSIPLECDLDSTKFKLKCIYLFKKMAKINHFLGVFHFNNGFYFFDDLKNEITNIRKLSGV
ncbi:unnamed protein product, partial [Brachionus calyciflorus]